MQTHTCECWIWWHQIQMNEHLNWIFDYFRFIKDFSAPFAVVIFGQNVLPIAALTGTIVAVRIFSDQMSHITMQYKFFFQSHTVNSQFNNSFGYFVDSTLLPLFACSANFEQSLFLYSPFIWIRFNNILFDCQSDEVCESIHLSEWYRLLKYRGSARSLEIFLMHTQLRNEIRAFGLFEFSFATLTQVTTENPI